MIGPRPGSAASWLHSGDRSQGSVRFMAADLRSYLHLRRPPLSSAAASCPAGTGCALAVHWMDAQLCGRGSTASPLTSASTCCAAVVAELVRSVSALPRCPCTPRLVQSCRLTVSTVSIRSAGILPLRLPCSRSPPGGWPEFIASSTRRGSSLYSVFPRTFPARASPTRTTAYTRMLLTLRRQRQDLWHFPLTDDRRA